MAEQKVNISNINFLGLVGSDTSPSYYISIQMFIIHSEFS